MNEQYSVPKGVTVVEHPLIRVKLGRLRDERTQTAEFRRLMNEIASLMAFEVTSRMETLPAVVRTPLMECASELLAWPVAIVPILRAGMGMVDGLLQVLPEASVGHVGLFRNEETLRPESYYLNLPPNIAKAEVIVVDPMLATGWSATAAIAQLKEKGASRIRFACVVSCPEGIAQIREAHPDVPVFTAVVDEGLNERGYILPGLGDAGDRFYGTV